MNGKYCLPKDLANNFKKLLGSGQIDVEYLAKSTSEERHAYFSKIVGEENATNVNGLFEKQILSNNFYGGLLRWAKTVSGITPQVRRDLVSKIEKMVADKKGNLLNPEEEKNFMQDLVETRLGLNLTSEEAKNITLLSNKMSEARIAFEKTGDGKEYGVAKSALERYLSEAKTKGVKSWSWNPIKMVGYIASNMKSIVASMDNSFAFRQGIKTLYTHPVIWSKNFLKSFNDLAKGFKNGRDDVIDGIKAEIYSRPNSINGLYDRMKLDIGGVEEAFPGNLGQKIPVFKRLYQASESAYEGMGIRLRADLADKISEKAISQGVDLTDSFQAESLGKLINSLTGRGSIGKLNTIGKEINAMFFSIKFAKGNFDVLTAHTLDKNMSSFARKEAATNLLKIVGSMAGVLAIADQFWPGSVDFDPRSANFGKIKIGDTRFDISGGLGSLVALAAREITGSSKNASTGVVSKLGATSNSPTRFDVLMNFFEGKLSPAFGIGRDILKGQDFSGNPVTVKGELYNSFIPMTAQTGIEAYKDPNAAPVLAAVIADGLGISVSTYAPSSTDWNNNQGVELQKFKEKVGEDKFTKANDDYNKKVNDWVNSMKNNSRFNSFSDEDQQKIINKKKTEIKNSVLRSYGFNYKQPPSKKLPKF